VTTLISFLGRTRKDNTSGYQRAIYLFDDGRRYTTPFFGSTLVERLQPQRTLLLGTAGSMWDVLDIDVESAEWAELGEATERRQVTQALLDRAAPRARAALPGAELVLIPYCDDETQQMELLGELAARVGEGERVVLDITHGFRHLPMLALVAARYLAHVRKARVSEIYYGALEMTHDGVTPVVRLDGLLRMLDWIEAFAAHDASGNYGVFAPLLARDGMQASSADALERAAHLERITNSTKAREIVLPMLTEIESLAGATQLFAPQLAHRLSWSRRPSRDTRERALFDAYLERRDFLRAAIYLQESAISAACNRLGIDSSEHASRDQARETLRDNPTMRDLSDIRNMLAHGTVSGDGRRTKAAVKAAQSASSLAQRLRELAHELDRMAW
jgi:CRISPR-associated Csx2 family protein